MSTAKERFDRQFSDLYDRAMSLTGREILINRKAYEEAGSIFYSLFLDVAINKGYAERELSQRLENGLTVTPEDRLINDTLKNLIEEFAPKAQKALGGYKRVCERLKLPATISEWSGRVSC